MGVAKTFIVFEAVTHRSVEGDVGEPDQGKGKRVADVLTSRANSRAGEIADHAEVGCEEQDREQWPGVSKDAVGKDGGAQYGEAFEAEPQTWLSGDGVRSQIFGCFK